MSDIDDTPGLGVELSAAALRFRGKRKIPELDCYLHCRQPLPTKQNYSNGRLNRVASIPPRAEVQNG